MITPETLLESTIKQYESSYMLNYSVASKKMKEVVLGDAIAWTSFKLYEKLFISKEEHSRIISMVHSKDEENLAVAEAIIRNLKFEF